MFEFFAADLPLGSHLHFGPTDTGDVADPGHAALGTGAVYERNLPPPGTFVIDPVDFAIRTSRNRKPNAPVAWPGHGTAAGQRIDAVGIVGNVLIVFDGQVVNAASAPTPTSQFPWNLIKNVVVSANGINNLFSCDGVDLRALCRVKNREMLFDRESIFAVGAGSATVQLRLIWEIPLAFDESLAGAVYAQTEETFLNVAWTTATAAEIWSANPGTITGNFRLLVTFYSIPIVDTQQGRKLVLPDITQLHGIVSRDDALTGTGDHIATLTRTGGILLRVMQRIDNSTFTGASFNVGNVDPSAGWTAGNFVQNVSSHRFRYGGNVVPLEYAGATFLKFLNQQDYGDAVLPSSDEPAGITPPAYLVDDFVVDSPMRDAIRLGGITEAQMINTISATVAVQNGARVHTVQEAMVAS